LTVPVSAVVEKDGKFFAWVKDKSGPHRRPLLVGQTNDKLIQITDGVKEGDEVILNPRAVVAEAREGSPVSVETDNADRFGKAASAVASSADVKAAPAGTKAAAAPDATRNTERGARSRGDAKSDGSRKSGEARRRSGRNRPALNFTQLDKNKDGKITPDELPEQMRGFFDRLDTDHDGAISKQELDDARKKMEARRRQQGDSPPGGQGPSQE